MKVCLYIHGKGGSFTEADFYKNLFDCDVMGLDYDDYIPWVARELVLEKYIELSQKYDKIDIIANSIGAWFTMLALSDRKIGKAYFISPMVNMEKLICDMMVWANVTETELQEKGEIQTSFGETLSWEYLTYVRNNSVNWSHTTSVLYGDKDNLVSSDTMKNFIKMHNASLTVMKDGEHWFHTQEQINFLSEWMKKEIAV